MKQHRKHSHEVKAKVALEASKDQKTANEISRESRITLFYLIFGHFGLDIGGDFKFNAEYRHLF